MSIVKVLLINHNLFSLYLRFIRFPAKYYCTMFGICVGISGSISFLQYPLLALEQQAFGGDQNCVSYFCIL